MKIYKTITLCLVMICFFSCKKSKSPVEAAEGEINYETTGDIFPNPERGFMKMFSVKSEGMPLNILQLEVLREQAISLVQRVYYFDLFKDKALSQAELDLIQTDMDVVRMAGLKTDRKS